MKSLTVVTGESEFLVSLDVARTRAAWEKKGYTVELFDTEQVDAVLDAISTPSLFDGGRLLVVTGKAAPLEKQADRFVAWAADPTPEVALVLGVGRATKLTKALGRHAEVIAVAAPKPWEVADWLVKHLKSMGRAIRKDAAETLVDSIGSDLRELAGRAEQLMTATTGPIGPKDVQRMFRGYEAQLYTFLESVLQRDLDGALRRLGALLGSGEYHPLVMTTTLATQFRALAAIKDPRSGSPAEIARELGVSAGYVNRAKKHARSFEVADIRNAFAVLAEADDTLKGGERGNELPDQLVVELVVGRLVGADAPAR